MEKETAADLGELKKNPKTLKKKIPVFFQTSSLSPDWHNEEPVKTRVLLTEAGGIFPFTGSGLQYPDEKDKFWNLM